jgi:ornithine carbamoyltransferase
MTFEVGMLQLGGEAIYLAPSDIQLGSREGIYDVGRNLERWVDGIMLRTFGHQILLDLAKSTRIPVINALTDLLHPCQAMADFFTLREKKGGLSALKLAYVGDGNNVCHSLMFAAAKAGTKMAVAAPEGYEPDSEIVQQALEDGKETGFSFLLTRDPAEAVRGADAVYTDTWTSMGQEAEKEKRTRIFASYQVNAALMARAKPDALFMHCLPAHRGEEVTDEVIDSPNSIVYDEAENRLHVQKVVCLLLMGKK